MERGSKEGWYYTVLKYTQLLQAYRDGMGEVRGMVWERYKGWYGRGTRDGMGEVRGMVWERYETKSRGLLQN